MVERNPVDLPGYVRRTREGPCFICEFVRGNPDFAHHLLYEDAQAIAFLSKYPVLRGYSLVGHHEIMIPLLAAAVLDADSRVQPA